MSIRNGEREVKARPEPFSNTEALGHYRQRGIAQPLAGVERSCSSVTAPAALITVLLELLIGRLDTGSRERG